MNAEHLRAYLGREWSVLEEESDRWRAERFREGGPAATMTASLALREQGWRIMGPPTEERRREDLAHHVELVQKLDRVSRGLAAR